MNREVLLIDDSPAMLKGLRRLLRKRYDLLIASDGEEALRILSNQNEIAVAVVDMKLPGMDGLEIFRRMQEISPNTIRIMITGSTDQQTAIDAINRGNIFRFYSKPCELQLLADGIDAALRQYELVISEKELLEKTLAGSVKLLVDILSMSDPISFRHTERVRNWAEAVANKLEVGQRWKLIMAATFAQLGNIAIPRVIMDKIYNDEELSAIEQGVVDAGPATAHDLLTNIPRLRPVAEIVALQKRGFDGTGFPAHGPVGTELPLEARILRILLDLDRHTRSTGSITTAFELLNSSASAYDPVLLNDIREILISEISTKASCPVKEVNLSGSL